MDSFKIGEDEFGVQSVNYQIENDIVFLEIYGDDEIYEKLTAEDESMWGWTLNSPNFYFRGFKCSENEVEIELNDSILDYCDMALYMMEHNDITGKFSIKDGIISVIGEVDIMGNIYKLEIVASMPTVT